MSEFKFVQWGKGTPVDYQRLNTMMLNEQYLKDVVDRSPRGTLMWKAATGPITIDPSGGYDVVSGFSSLIFDVEEDRLTSFYFNPGQTANNSLICQFRIAFIIDGNNAPVVGGGGFPTTGTPVTSYSGQAPGFYVNPTALSKGTHSVSVAIQADTGNTGIVLATSGQCSIIVRDEGKFISASS